MPLDPHDCRAYAKRCMELATETTDPNAQEILLNTAQGWERLAASWQTPKNCWHRQAMSGTNRSPELRWMPH